MVSSGTMILILILFLVAVSVSFYSGFFVGKKSVRVIPPQGIPQIEPPDKTFFEKVADYIEDAIFRKGEKEHTEDVKQVITIDGRAKNDNDFL
jgi:hypothetical protein